MQDLMNEAAVARIKELEAEKAELIEINEALALALAEERRGRAEDNAASQAQIAQLLKDRDYEV